MYRHPFLKRSFAAAIDLLLIAILTVFLAMPMSRITGFRSARDEVNEVSARIKEESGISADLTPQEYQSLTDEQIEKYEALWIEYLNHEQNVRTYNRMVIGSYLTILGSILVAVIVFELAIPLVLGDGQTLGKKLMGLAVIKMDGEAVDAIGIIARALLGKFLVEIALPVFSFLSIYNGMSGSMNTVLIIGLFLVQAACMGFTKERRLIHDFLSGTRVVALDSEEFGI